MKIKRFALITLSMIVVVVLGFFIYQEVRDAPPKKIISNFIEGENLDVQPGTEEYRNLMKGIMLGNYPELTAENSPYIKNENELRLVMSYVGRNMYSGVEKYFRTRHQEPEVQEAPTSEP